MNYVAITSLAIGTFVLGYITCGFVSQGGLEKVNTAVNSSNQPSIEENYTDSNFSESDSQTGNEVAFTIKVSDLSSGQQAILRGLGINESELAITNSMVACAEAKLGTGRVNEIRGGATPSFTEGAQLVACYNGS